VKKYTLYITIYLGAVLMLSSCYTVSTMQTDVLHPGNKVFPSDIYRVGVLSRLDMDSRRLADDIDMEEKMLFQREKKIFEDVITATLDGLAESPRFEAYQVKPNSILSPAESSPQRPLSWRRIESMGRKDSLDMIISLSTIILEDSIVLDNGLDESYVIYPRLYWRHYDIKRKEFDQFIYNDTLNFPGGFGGTRPPDEKILVYFSEAVGDAGYNYSMSIAPYWVAENRAWYISGDPLLRKAATMANEGKWEEASEIWRKLAYSPKVPIASRASFNLALAAEMMDKFDLALEWVNRSIELGLSYYPKYYKEVIEKRQKDRLKLDEQMK